MAIPAMAAMLTLLGDDDGDSPYLIERSSFVMYDVVMPVVEDAFSGVGTATERVWTHGVPPAPIGLV